MYKVLRLKFRPPKFSWWSARNWTVNREYRPDLDQCARSWYIKSLTNIFFGKNKEKPAGISFSPKTKGWSKVVWKISKIWSALVPSRIFSNLFVKVYWWEDTFWYSVLQKVNIWTTWYISYVGLHKGNMKCMHTLCEPKWCNGDFYRYFFWFDKNISFDLPPLHFPIWTNVQFWQKPGSFL